MKKKFEALEDNFVYTFTETDMPENVISSDVGNNIISLMYTLKTGTYHIDEEDEEDTSDTDATEEEATEDADKKDEEKPVALAEISNISTSNDKFTLEASFRGTDKEIINELSELYLTTSGLCDIDYKDSAIKDTWPSKDNEKLAGFFIDALGAEETVFESDLKSNECDIFSAKAKLSIISYQCNIHHGEAALSNICNYLKGLTE